VERTVTPRNKAEAERSQARILRYVELVKHIPMSASGPRLRKLLSQALAQVDEELPRL